MKRCDSLPHSVTFHKVVQQHTLKVFSDSIIAHFLLILTVKEF